eukprot:c18147_g1_i4 orf=270-494(-)
MSRGDSDNNSSIDDNYIVAGIQTIAPQQMITVHHMTRNYEREAKATGAEEGREDKGVEEQACGRPNFSCGPKGM